MPDDNVIELALSLETAVWASLVSGDPIADAALLAADFLGVYPTGFAGRDDHSAQLADGPTVESFGLSSLKADMVATDLLRLSYRADYRRPGKITDDTMYVTSLWEHRSGQWLNTFSQDTPAADTRSSEGG